MRNNIPSHKTLFYTRNRNLVKMKAYLFLLLLFQIANLGIMTGRLLPPFLQHLKSDYVSVRLEAVKVYSVLQLFSLFCRTADRISYVSLAKELRILRHDTITK